MDTAERIETAKQRLMAGREIALQAARAGPPCHKCHHYTRFDPDAIKARQEFPERPVTIAEVKRCAHPANTQHVFDPARGVFEDIVHLSAYDARSEGGLCGPEGALFDPLTIGDRARLAAEKLVYGGILAGVIGGAVWLVGGS